MSVLEEWMHEIQILLQGKEYFNSNTNKSGQGHWFRHWFFYIFHWCFRVKLECLCFLCSFEYLSLYKKTWVLPKMLNEYSSIIVLISVGEWLETPLFPHFYFHRFLTSNCPISVQFDSKQTRSTSCTMTSIAFFSVSNASMSYQLQHPSLPNFSILFTIIL